MLFGRFAPENAPCARTVLVRARLRRTPAARR